VSALGKHGWRPSELDAVPTPQRLKKGIAHKIASNQRMYAQCLKAIRSGFGNELLFSKCGSCYTYFDAKTDWLDRQLTINSPVYCTNKNK
jgi:hypothetical protein